MGSTPNSWDLETRSNEWPTVLTVTEKAPGLSSAEVAAGAGLTADKVEAIEAGYAPEVAANFSKLYDWARAQGFRMTGRLPHEYEQVVRQSPSHLEEFAERIPIGEKVAAEGVNCFECHQGPGWFLPEGSNCLGPGSDQYPGPLAGGVGA